MSTIIVLCWRLVTSSTARVIFLTNSPDSWSCCRIAWWYPTWRLRVLSRSGFHKSSILTETTGLPPEDGVSPHRTPLVTITALVFDSNALRSPCWASLNDQNCSPNSSMLAVATKALLNFLWRLGMTWLGSFSLPTALCGVTLIMRSPVCLHLKIGSTLLSMVTMPLFRSLTNPRWAWACNERSSGVLPMAKVEAKRQNTGSFCRGPSFS